MFSKYDFFLYLLRLKNNFNMILTTSKKEYKSYISTSYGFYEGNIKLTGLSRYDSLQQINKNKKLEKIILIIPNWRMNIKGTFDFLTYNSIYSPFFKVSQYFEFYNSLINNKKLLKSMDELNYKGYFCLHPYFSSQYIDFTQNSFFKIKKSCDYQELLLRGSLLVTDYSNIFFDFAYMKKPIIYTQFDFKQYNENSYFNYKKDGFGPIYDDIEKTVNGIIESMENNCLLKSKYLRRIKKYFTYFDNKNNVRIFNAITGMSEKSNIIFKIDKYICSIVLIFVCLFKILNNVSKKSYYWFI